MTTTNGKAGEGAYWASHKIIENSFPETWKEYEGLRKDIEQALHSAEEMAKEKDALIAAMEYGDGLLLNLLAEKGVKVDGISTGIIQLAAERSALKAENEKLKRELDEIYVRMNYLEHGDGRSL